jgi:gliding motility-associated-like protein
VQVTVNPLPTAQASTDTSICNQTTIGLTAGGGQTYSWTPATGLNNPNIPNPNATPNTTTTYTVTATDANGCTDTEDVTISVNAQPKSDFDLMQDSTIASCEGIRITLENNSTDAIDYKWYLGGVGNISNDFEPSSTYPFGGNPTITLISINNFCSDTLRKTFQLGSVDDYLDSLPNAFSPNNDGINDCFDLGKSNEFYGCSNWTIINRWGEVVYKSKSDNDCWNGKRDGDGADMPEGTYFYIIRIFDSTRQGALLLSR